MEEVVNENKINVEEDKLNKSNNNSGKSKRKYFFIIPIICVLVLALLLVFLYFNNTSVVRNVKVENTGFHEIEISWDKVKNTLDYVVLISSEEISNKEIDDDLKDGKLDLSYQILEIKDSNKTKYDMVMSNTDYYISVVSYKEKDKKRKYSKSSNVVKIHTDPLKVDKITDLMVDDVTDTSIRLKWSLFDTTYKNLDDTPISISYTLASIRDDELAELYSDIKEDNYYITELKPFTKYSYSIVVNTIVDGNVVNSENSDVLEVTTKPAPVSGVFSKSGGTDSISISWDEYDRNNIDNLDGTITYSVYGSDSENGEYQLLGENLSSNSYTENGLDQNKTRYYYVVANILIDNESYATNRSGIVSATTDKKKVTSNSGTSSGGSGSSSSGGLTAAEKKAQARVIAKQIANSITGSTDLEKVSKAAQAVSAYYYRGVHKESGSDYNTAYGVFIKGESSCAGTTRALGMVLEEMGYSWKHANENQWTHQWVIITMDGQVGFADGQVGWAGYGPHPLE